MRTTALTLPTALLGVLLLAACGSQQVAGQGSPQAQGSGAPSCGARTPAAPPGAGASQSSGSADDAEQDGVRITAQGSRAAECGPPVATRFAVTNHHTRPFTFTVTFTFVSDSGEALSVTRQTVSSVGPGRTVQRAVGTPDHDSPTSRAARVVVSRVRSVPADEAPATAGPCPPSGIRVTSDDGDAAMGLRVVGLHLENCSAVVRHLDGYPLIQLLDERRNTVPGVRILRGSGGIATVTGFDDPPRPLTLKPGERASSGLLWRNTVTSGTSVDVPYVRVRADSAAHPVTVTPELDLGTTGRLGVSAWRKDGSSRAGG